METTNIQTEIHIVWLGGTMAIRNSLFSEPKFCYTFKIGTENVSV